MIRIEDATELDYEKIGMTVLDRGDKVTWDSSDKRIALYDDAMLLLYAGVVKDDGWYLWVTVSEEFHSRYPLAVRYCFRTLNHFIREGFSPMWCLVDNELKQNQRLVRMAGFEFTGTLQMRKGRLYRKYRRG